MPGERQPVARQDSRAAHEPRIRTDNESRPGTLPAPRNAWYVVAFSNEVGTKPLSRRILGNRLLFYRTDDGQPVALADYCAHRAMALSQGKVVSGDRIKCPYHGIEYDRSGACVRVPSQAQVPRSMKVRSYPLVEKWRWIWAWMGDPAKADETLIPDHAEFGLAEGDGFRKTQRFMMPIGGNFQLLHENLLDVSHISFLHEGLFDSGSVASAPATTEIENGVITITRRVTETMSGVFAAQFEIAAGTRVDRQLISRTWVPNLNLITNILSFPDHPERAPAIRHSPFPITPETDRSCHYFAAVAANYGKAQEGEELAKALQTTWDIFMADKLAIETIQQAYDEFGLLTPDTSVRADAAAIRFRRVLKGQVEAERGERSANMEAFPEACQTKGSRDAI